MGFAEKQVKALGRNVPARHVKSRIREGKELHYVEGWYVVAQANRIFGFDGWDRETVETRCILARETRGTFTAVYSARVQVTVRTAAEVVVRDGHGTGEAHGSSAGEVHDRALKAAETDATKRALATFGKAFGLALYAGHRQPAVRGRRTAPQDRRQTVSDDGRSESPQERLSPSNEVTQIVSAALDQDLLVAATRRPTTQVDKSTLTLSEPHRVRDKRHLRYVASQPCLVCDKTPCDAHHVRFAQPRALGRKVSDEFTVPLCRSHHREVHHSGGEASWWHDLGIDPLNIARQLWVDGSRL